MAPSSRPRVVCVLPPLTQLNTPYPSTAYLTGFLRSQGVPCAQVDAGLALVLRALSPDGLRRLGEVARQGGKTLPGWFTSREAEYAARVGPAVRFLQGKEPTLALRIVGRGFLPEGPRFRALDDPAVAGPGADPLAWAFGTLGTQDRAKFLCSLFVDDLADAIGTVEPEFALSRYGERLAASQASFDPLAEALRAPPGLLDPWLDEIAADLVERHRPDLVVLSAPFPGNVLGALKLGRALRRLAPGARIALGGGYANTELRELEDGRVFEFVDYVCLDDGERPLLCLIEHLEGTRPRERLMRTFTRDPADPSRALLVDGSGEHDLPQARLPAPVYDGLPLGEYLSLLELLNPMHRIWSDGRWNKLTLAHGCYWKKCAFCDVTLDYIGRYDPAPVEALLDRMEEVARETGQSGFHFVDEAAPPALLRRLAEGILERGLTFTWWGNIRFDQVFTPELCDLLARSGCVAVSGGLEVASPRLLAKMRKGVSVEGVARVTRAFRDAGVRVHAYLMYGFPTQTDQETVDALERVRQLFAEGCLDSAFWHRFSTTAHSPVGKDPAAYGVVLREASTRGPRFARNDLPFDDPTGGDHDRMGPGLKRALHNYLLGTGLDLDAGEWFKPELGRERLRASVPEDLISRALRGDPPEESPLPPPPPPPPPSRPAPASRPARSPVAPRVPRAKAPRPPRASAAKRRKRRRP